MPSKNRISAAVGAVTGAPSMLLGAALAFSPAAWALGLGEATVQSYLNQPLQAKIDLISQATDDLSTVTAQLASAADYELIGADRESVSVPIGFSIEDIDGDAYIVATSKLPINDPVLRLIVEVNWANGRLLREYTLFLDPPTVPAQAPIPRVEQRKAPPPPAAAPTPAPTPAPEPAATAPADSAPAASRPSAATIEGGQDYGPVRSGETLWGIANEWSRGSGVDINRVMIAIQQQNPDAFLNDNINLLKRGAILRMPTAADIERISSSSAYREVASQEAEFTGRSEPDTVTSPDIPLIAEESAAMERPEPPAAVEEPADSAPVPEAAESEASEAAAAAEPGAGELAETSEQAPEPGDTATTDPQPRDQLELVPPVEDSLLASASGFEEGSGEGEAGVSVQALQENLARTEEELITQQQQNAYLEERIRELEAELESAGSGQVADADLANMEDRLRQQRPSAAADERPWYTRGMVWLIGLLVLIAAFIGWLISRRGGDEEAADSIEEIKTEAEDLLRVLSDAPAEQADAGSEAEAAPEAGQDEPEEAGADEPEEGETEPAKFAGVEDDAEVLDEESSDPEIQLDLARAYISMGDKEAARVILEEVVANGTEDQQEEARKMLELLV